MNKVYFMLFFLMCVAIDDVSAQEVIEKNYATFKDFLGEQNDKLASVVDSLTIGEVYDIMGGKVLVKIPKVGKMKPLKKLFKQPEFTNQFSKASDKKTTILWYFSTPKDQNGLISKRECTPVILVNGIVVGKGWTFFNNYRKTNSLR